MKEICMQSRDRPVKTKEYQSSSTVIGHGSRHFELSTVRDKQSSLSAVLRPFSILHELRSIQNFPASEPRQANGVILQATVVQMMILQPNFNPSSVESLRPPIKFTRLLFTMLRNHRFRNLLRLRVA